MKTSEELLGATEELELGFAENCSFMPYQNDEPGQQEVIIKTPKTKKANFLFPPTVLESSRSVIDGTLEVCAHVLINSTMDVIITDTPVSYNLNRTPPEFYISYQGPRDESTQFRLYEISFTVPNFPSKYKEIATFLRHTDPETSRGTETTVQPM